MSEDKLTEATRGQLGEVRRALLHLHKTLLDDERAGYELVRGRIESSGAFLQLVLNDEWFAYLRPLSALVVGIDELLDAEDAAQGEADALIARARQMLRPDESGVGGLGERYQAALQRAPEVVLAHAAVMRLVAGQKSGEQPR